MSLPIRVLSRELQVRSHPRVLSFEQHELVKRHLRRLYDLSTFIHAEALAQIDLRRCAEGSDLPLSEYLTRGPALVDYTNAGLEAVRLVMPAFIRECRAIGLSQDLPSAAYQEIEMFCGWFHIPESFLFLLKMEFVDPLLSEAFDAPFVIPPETTTGPSGLPSSRPGWDPELHAIVRGYFLECERAGVSITATSVYKLSRVDKADYYKWLRGEMKGSALDRRIRNLCQVEKPHLKSRAQ